MLQTTAKIKVLDPLGMYAHNMQFGRQFDEMGIQDN